MNDTSEEELRKNVARILYDDHNDTCEGCGWSFEAQLRSETTDQLMQLIKAYGLQKQIEALESVKSCFADLQDAEEAVYIESNYIDPRIATLTALKKATATSNGVKGDES